MAEEIKKELENEETKATEEAQANENQETTEVATVEEKKGFHPIQALKAKGAEIGKKHPKAVSVLKTTGKVAAGIGIGVVGTVAVLASVAAKQGDSSDDGDLDLGDLDMNPIDVDATEVKDDIE
jgi:hypothetical protein